MKEKIGRAKYIPEAELSKFEDITRELKQQAIKLANEGVENA